MKKHILAAALLTTATVATGPVLEAMAAESNPAIVHRQGTYKVVGGHMGSLKSILFLGWEGNAAYHAEAIKNAWDNMGNAYPEGSDFGETRAKAAIWENMADYQEKGKNAYMATLKLVETTKAGDKAASIEAFKALGGACKACHQDYREK